MAKQRRFVQRWTHEQVEEFRVHQRALVDKLYPTDAALRLELHRAREKWIGGVLPKTPKEST